MMTERPDSSLQLIYGIDTLALKSREDVALYSLLLTQAEDKNYIDRTDARIIRRAADYYGRSGDEYHKMLSYFYLARIEQNAEDYSKAIVDLMKAEKAGLAIEDYFYLGMIYRTFSEIYNNIYSMVESLHYARKSYDCFVKSGKENYVVWAMEDVCRAYHNGGDYKESVRIANEIVKIAEANDDKVLLSRGLRLLGISCLGDGKYKESLDAYRVLFDVCTDMLILSDYRDIGVAYLRDNQIDKANYYMNYVEKNDNSDNWLSYKMYAATGDFKSAYFALEQEYKYQDRILREVLGQNVTEAVIGYKEFEQEQNEQELEFERKSKIFSISILVLTSLLLLVLLLYLLKSYRRKVEDTLSFAADLQYSLNDTKERNSNLQSAIGALYGHSFKTIDDLCGECYNDKNGTVIVKKVKTIVKGLKNDTNTIEQLECFVNNYSDKVMLHFRTDFPDLRDVDYKLFLYLAAGFSLRTISVLVDVELDALYNRKARLKQRINKGNSQYKNQFLETIG